MAETNSSSNPPHTPDESKAQTSHDILAELDNIADSLVQNWKGKIVVDLDRNGCGRLQEYNLCDHIGKYKNEIYDRFYFNTTEYPPPPVGSQSIPKDYKSWNDLKLYITRQSHECGSPVVANGSNNNGSRKFVCFCHRLYKEDANKKKGPFREDFIVNSKNRGSRPNGRDAARRCSTKLALSRDKICKFKFQISWDEKGYFLKQTSGNPNHEFHPKIDPSNIPIPTRLIPENEKANLVALAESCVGAGVGRNFIHSKLGRYITRAKVAYLQENYNVDFTGQNLPQNDIEKLLEFFKNSETISHQVLWDVPVDDVNDSICSQGVTVATTSTEKTACVDTSDTTSTHASLNKTSTASKPTTASTNKKPPSPQKLVSTCFDRENSNEPYYVDHTEETGMEVLIKEAQHIRTSKNISDSAKIFLCVAWSSVEEIRMFKRFPELIYCDATADTNNTKNQLVTFSGRTCDGKQFIFLRIWIHNQRTSTFQWIFRVVLKTFIPDAFYKQVQMCLVDGDPQQRVKLTEALQTYLKNAKHSTCTHHLITNGWKKYQPSIMSISPQQRSRYDRFSRILTNWLFSFSRPGYCENETEYTISKQLLYAFVRSTQARTILTTSQNVRTVQEWLRNHVLIKDNQFLYFQRKHLRYYYQATTSPHEGTNHGIKSHAARVRPNQTMFKAGKALSMQSTLKIGEFNHDSSKAVFMNTTWSNSTTSKHIVTKAESLLQKAMHKSSNYDVKRNSFSSWQVFYNNENNENSNPSDESNSSSTSNGDSSHDETKTSHTPNIQKENPFDDLKTNKKWSPIPLFNRVREVHMDEMKCLRCSCYQFECIGLPCHHIAAVIKFSFPSWDGFSHHDCSIQWWKIWHHYAYSKNAVGISTVLSRSKFLPVTGACFPSEDRNPPEPTSAYVDKVIVNIRESIRNYSLDQLNHLIGDPEMMLRSQTSEYEGLSQTENILNDDDDYLANVLDGNDHFGPLLEGGPIAAPQDMFEELKHDFYELLSVLETHKKEFPDSDKCNEIRSLMQEATNEMRLSLFDSDSNRKRKATDNRVINIMTEARARTISRKYNSKNC